MGIRGFCWKLAGLAAAVWVILAPACAFSPVWAQGQAEAGPGAYSRAEFEWWTEEQYCLAREDALKNNDRELAIMTVRRLAAKILDWQTVYPCEQGKVIAAFPKLGGESFLELKAQLRVFKLKFSDLPGVDEDRVRLRAMQQTFALWKQGHRNTQSLIFYLNRTGTRFDELRHTASDKHWFVQGFNPPLVNAEGK